MNSITSSGFSWYIDLLFFSIFVCAGPYKVEIDLMQPINPDKSPKVFYYLYKFILELHINITWKGKIKKIGFYGHSLGPRSCLESYWIVGRQSLWSGKRQLIFSWCLISKPPSLFWLCSYYYYYTYHYSYYYHYHHHYSYYRCICILQVLEMTSKGVVFTPGGIRKGLTHYPIYLLLISILMLLLLIPDQKC